MSHEVQWKTKVQIIENIKQKIIGPCYTKLKMKHVKNMMETNKKTYFSKLQEYQNL
jgi:hypothetical protein